MFHHFYAGDNHPLHLLDGTQGNEPRFVLDCDSCSVICDGYSYGYSYGSHLKFSVSMYSKEGMGIFEWFGEIFWIMIDELDRRERLMNRIPLDKKMG